MLTYLTPPEMLKPSSSFSHGVVVPPNARWLFTGGLVGYNAEGKLAEGFEAQLRQTLTNLVAVLRAGGMEPRDVVAVNYFVTDRSQIAVMRAIRGEYLGDIAPAATLTIPAALGHPDWLFEMNAVAARP